MIFLRYRGTPDTWRASRRTSRWSQRDAWLSMLILGALALACLGFAGGLGIVEIADMLGPRGGFHAVVWLVVAVPTLIGLFVGWLAWEDWIAPPRFLEIDWTARRILSYAADGLVGVPPLTEAERRPGLYARTAWVVSFDDLRPLLVVQGEARTITLERGQARVVGTSIAMFERILGANGMQVFGDRMGGAVPGIAARLAAATNQTVIWLRPPPPTAIPHGFAMGTKVRYGERIGFVSQAVLDATPHGPVVKLLVLFEHGGRMALAPQEVHRVA